MNSKSSLTLAYRYCESMAKSHYENFPVGSLLVPKAQRPYVWSVYAFARSADDFADEDYPLRTHFPTLGAWKDKILEQEKSRLEKLNEWENLLLECIEGKASHPIFIALGNTIQHLKLPLQLFLDLITAFKMDVTKRRYETWEEVLYYCKHSANPVGRLILRIFGYEDSQLDEMSDAICSGLQLANFWQDIALDREKDRIYIPLEMGRKHSLNFETFFSENSLFDWNPLLQELGELTLRLFIQGKGLPLQVKGRLSWELKCTWLGGMNILKQACFNDRRQGLERPRIRSWDKLKILLHSFLGYQKQTLRLAKV